MSEADAISLLIEACAGGDDQALAQLHQREGGRMIGVALRILKRRTLAEEAMQDSFVLVWRHARRFDRSLGNGRTWLYAILRHRSLEILRKESRFDLTDDITVFEGASEADDAQTLMEKLDGASRLRSCLARLEPKRRAAILLSFAHGLSHGELAERLRLPLGTLKSWIRRGMQNLKECLQ